MKGRVKMATTVPEVVTPADWVPGPKQGEWTYDDYKKLPDDGNRYEILNGVLLLMPSPKDSHQNAAGWIYHHLVIHVRLAGLGKVRMAPLDVKLDEKNTFQPDVLVVLNEHLDRLTEDGVMGAPDLTVEVLSPSTALEDRVDKHREYALAGVPEYWIVSTERHTVEVFTLKGREYRSLGIFSGKDTLPSKIVPNIPVHVEQFFEE
jgi:Uma2 family endonuclease